MIKTTVFYLHELQREIIIFLVLRRPAEKEQTIGFMGAATFMVSESTAKGTYNTALKRQAEHFTLLTLIHKRKSVWKGSQNRWNSHKVSQEQLKSEKRLRMGAENE